MPSSNNNNNNNNDLDLCYACIRTHHLFDHKPDNTLRSGHKFDLRGYYKFGTPGIAVVVGSTRHSIEGFVDLLNSKMPQKKFELVFERSLAMSPTSTPNNQLLPQGWTELPDAKSLKVEIEKLSSAISDGSSGVVIQDDDYYTILGIDSQQSPGDSIETNGKGGKAGGKAGGKGGSKSTIGKKKR
jgi:hypothetical protein